MKTGDRLSCERTFTEEDIRLFAKFSGDEGRHHTLPDKAGRLMAHGLLTATLPTKLGGEINFIARDMRFLFHRPVFAGDTVRCEVTIIELEEAAEFYQLKCSWSCLNQHGKEVMSGESTGVVRK
ncbi:MAG TPA: MaoC family dehydratase [Pyrinomonadaceae bacterium]|jgi:acyl dehydratase